MSEDRVEHEAEASPIASVAAAAASLLDAPVAFVDLETTGGGPAYHRIIEVGIVAANANGLEYEWSTLINPGRPISYGVQALTGITEEMVERAPAFEDVAAIVAERLEGRLFVAHNAQFDYGFLREEFRRSGIRFESRVACTVRLSRRVNPGMRRHNLDTLIAYLGLRISARHRALPDAQALWQFWEELRARPDRADIDAALERITRATKPKLRLQRVLDVVEPAPAPTIYVDASPYNDGVAPPSVNAGSLSVAPTGAGESADVSVAAPGTVELAGVDAA